MGGGEWDGFHPHYTNHIRENIDKKQSLKYVYAEIMPL